MIESFLFAVIVSGFYVAKIIIFPLYVVIAYADIIYISITFFLFAFALGLFLIKKFYLLTKSSISIFLVALVLIAGSSAYYEATLYIQKVAEKKYHTKPTWLRINLDPWTAFVVFGHPHYTSHAEIQVNNQIYYWSFNERDFIKL